VTDTFESAPGIFLKRVGKFSTTGFVRRHPANPRPDPHHDMPYPSHLVFNASVLEHQGRFVMLFPNEVYDEWGVTTGGRHHLGLAYSDDGLHWEPDPEPIHIGLEDYGVRESAS
jgi:beta-1,4-mannooligosaccharide/beta-1,4-mannosyl-N-acetylglucosamine phosphorylase